MVGLRIQSHRSSMEVVRSDRSLHTDRRDISAHTCAFRSSTFARTRPRMSLEPNAHHVAAPRAGLRHSADGNSSFHKNMSEAGPGQRTEGKNPDGMAVYIGGDTLAHHAPFPVRCCARQAPACARKAHRSYVALDTDHMEDLPCGCRNICTSASCSREFGTPDTSTSDEGCRSGVAVHPVNVRIRSCLATIGQPQENKRTEKRGVGGKPQI
jgi:hypothetical protein